MFLITILIYLNHIQIIEHAYFTVCYIYTKNTLGCKILNRISEFEFWIQKLYFRLGSHHLYGRQPIDN